MARTSTVRNSKQQRKLKNRGKVQNLGRSQARAAGVDAPNANPRKGEAAGSNNGEHVIRQEITGDSIYMSAVGEAYRHAMEFALTASQTLAILSLRSLQPWQAAWWRDKPLQ